MRAVAVTCLLLTLGLAAPARAAGTTASATQSSPTLPLPAPDTFRLIPIGPQALLQEDAQGRLTMADEPPPKPSRRRNVAALLMGLLSAGAIVTFGRNDLTGGGGLRSGSR